MRFACPVALLTAFLFGSVGCGTAKEGPADAETAAQAPNVAQRDLGAATDGASAQGRKTAKHLGSMELAYVPLDGVAAMIAHPRRVFASSAVTRAAAPEEVLAQLMAAPFLGMEYDLQKVERVIALVAPAVTDARGRVTDRGDLWIVRFSEKVEPTRLLRTAWRPLLAPTAPRIDQTTYEGKTYYRRQYPQDVLFGAEFPVDGAFLPDDHTVVFAQESRLRRIWSAKEEKGLLRERLRETDLDHDLIVALAPEPEETAKWRAGGLAPAFADIAEELRFATLTADLDSLTPLEVVLEAGNAQGAARVETLAKAAMDEFRAMLAAMPQPAPRDEPMFSVAVELIGGRTLRNFETTRKADRVVVRLKRPPGTDDLLPKLIAHWVAQAEARAREYAEGSRQRNKLAELARAVHHEMTRNRLPHPALRDKDGKPLLSWRVQILPYLDQKALYKEFHLDEPWDSEHNRKLIERMPEAFTSASAEGKGKTRFMLFVGPGTAFDGEKPVFSDAIRDGLSNTIMMAEAGPDRAVPWTKPEDLPFDPDNPMAALGKVAERGFPVAFFDGRVEWLGKDVSPVKLRQWIDPNDRQPMRDDDERGGKEAVAVPEKTSTKTPDP